MWALNLRWVTFIDIAILHPFQNTGRVEHMSTIRSLSHLVFIVKLTQADDALVFTIFYIKILELLFFVLLEQLLDPLVPYFE